VCELFEWLAEKPVWVSFTLEDSTSCCLRSSEPLAAAIQSIRQHAHLAAVLVNCCAPAAVTAALPVMKQHVPAGEHSNAVIVLPTAELPAVLFDIRFILAVLLKLLTCLRKRISL
jgi:S-methylmethionine-dependent homocysteine/selenocysteine methylase